MTNKRYWLRGGFIGVVVGIILWISTQIMCSAFLVIGSAYPTDQPICYALIVNERWVEVVIISVILGLLLGCLFGMTKKSKIV